MPHCIIECPESVAELIPFETLVGIVHDAAEATGLFEAGDVKARLLAYQYAVAGGREQPHVHVTIRLLAGRSKADRATLSKTVAQAVCDALTTVYLLSVEVVQIDQATYTNRRMLS